MITNPIGDMMNRMKIAGEMKKETVTVPLSRLRLSVAEALARTGFVGQFVGQVAKKGKKVVRSLEIGLKYGEDGVPRVSGVRILSRPARRMYMGAKDIRSVRHGYGALFLSTPQGIMTGSEARKAKVGGEALFEIW